MKQENVKSESSNVDPEQQWREKLLDECQEEFFETYGQYDGELLVLVHPALIHTLYLGFLTIGWLSYISQLLIK